MLTLLHGDALTQLKTLESESVQTCVTSPPYWGLRDYGTATWEGGSPECDHLTPQGQRQDVERGNHNGGMAGFHGGATTELKTKPFSGDCGKCGATRVDIQIGLEKTPEAYVAALVDVFREVKRVLRNDGTLWLNLGDTYAAQRGGTWMPPQSLEANDKVRKRGDESSYLSHRNAAAFGLKHKDLVGIPWMVAFALRADGWYLRSDIIWSKPNPMPESVTDRPTKSHEYIFLLSKSAKYYYDAEAIKEPPSGNSHGGGRQNATRKTWLTHGEKSHKGLATAERSGQDGRNRRSVWTVSTFHFSDAHFATFPPALITPCILAGSKAGDVVLDPFAGSGTTGKVAIELGRKAILIEPKAEYVEMIERRCKTTIGLPLAV